MNTSHCRNKEGSGIESIEVIHQVVKFGFGEGAAICQVCGSFLSGGECVAVYVFRPVSWLSFQFGYVLCSEHWDAFVSEWTLGVREVVVRGRVGRVVDQAMQSSRPVLMAPVPVVVSPVACRDAVRVGSECSVAVGGDDGAEECCDDAGVDGDGELGVDELREPSKSMRPVTSSEPCIAIDSDDSTGVDELREPSKSMRPVTGSGPRVGEVEDDAVGDEWTDADGDGGGA